MATLHSIILDILRSYIFVVTPVFNLRLYLKVVFVNLTCVAFIVTYLSWSAFCESSLSSLDPSGCGGSN